MDGQDHDLLIELRTEMRAVRVDIKDLKDNTSKRVDALESEKINAVEVFRMKQDADDIHHDHEKRLKKIESLTIYWAGGLAVINIIIGIAVAVLLKKL